MFLGIDLGTSSVKTVLMDDDQQIIASSSAALTVERSHDGWSEQDAVSWISATEKTLNELHQKHKASLAAVKGIGLSGHMHGATLIDSSDNVLRPCILWNDTRSHAEAAELDTSQSRDICGNILFPGFTSPKLSWVAKNEPFVFEKTSKVLLPKDFLRLWLTGEHVSEMSDAAGTGWLDVAKRDWSDTQLKATGLDQSHMPSLVEGSDISGTLRKALAQQFGMSDQVVVAGGAGDNAASACGMGTIKAGNAFLSLGTSGVLFASNARYQPNAKSAVHAFCHAVPNTWHQMGVILAATDALNWLAGVTGKSPAELTTMLEGDTPRPTEVLFLPYLGGERTPHNDAMARGVFTGLSHKSDTKEMAQAVLQGVAFAFADCQAALTTAGTQIQSAYAVGGGAKSNYWLSMLSSTLKLPLQVAVDGDFGASLGAARLGMIAATGSAPATICTTPDVAKTIEPDASVSNGFIEQYQRYKHLYAALESV